MSCASSTLDSGVAPEWDAPREIAVLRIELKATDETTGGRHARIGDISLRYKARF